MAEMAELRAHYEKFANFDSYAAAVVCGSKANDIFEQMCEGNQWVNLEFSKSKHISQSLKLKQFFLIFASGFNFEIKLLLNLHKHGTQQSVKKKN